MISAGRKCVLMTRSHGFLPARSLGKQTMLKSKKPVIAVCAVRTGCGKSQTTRKVCEYLKALGKKVAVIRHPMPYGDLVKQACQRYAKLADMDLHKCTIEEREEYEPHIAAVTSLCRAWTTANRSVRRAEAEADVILWDGGQQRPALLQPDLHIVVTDPLRARPRAGTTPARPTCAWPFA